MTRAAIILVLMAINASCRSNNLRINVTHRDSSGVDIVESIGPAWAEGDAWSVDPVPSLDLTRTGQGPSHEFYQVEDAFRLPEGYIVVANGGSHEIRIFSSAGTIVNTIGQEGEGPGEFRRLSTTELWRGDSLIAFDARLVRTTVFARAVLWGARSLAIRRK